MHECRCPRQLAIRKVALQPQALTGILGSAIPAIRDKHINLVSDAIERFSPPTSFLSLD
jgi:hypothetical protein